VRGPAVFQRMQFLARLESNGLSGGDADLGSGAWVSADAGFAGADAEDAEAAQLNALTGSQGLLEALEDSIHRGFRLGAGQARALNHMMDDVLLNQWGTLVRETGLAEIRPMQVIVQVLYRMWNRGNGMKCGWDAFSPEEYPGGGICGDEGAAAGAALRDASGESDCQGCGGTRKINR